MIPESQTSLSLKFLTYRRVWFSGISSMFSADFTNTYVPYAWIMWGRTGATLLWITWLNAIRNCSGDLTEIFSTYPDDHNHHRFDRWLQYARFYEINTEHLLTKQSVTMLEIGVQNGGSIAVWKRYFEDNNLTYVGLDIEPKCASLSNPAQKEHVYIGSQSDVSTLHRLCQLHGPFDFVVDDGGHFTEGMMVSLETLWTTPNCLSDTAVYAIEDTHAMTIFPSATQQYRGKDFFGHMADLMRYSSAYLSIARQPESNTFVEVIGTPHPLAKHIYAMHVYDSMVVLHYQESWEPLQKISRGKRMDVLRIAK